MLRPLAIALGLCAAAACGRTEPFPQAPEGGPDRSSVRRDASFSGLWLVDQPGHALYEATYYLLEPDGVVKQLLSIGVDGHLKDIGETGFVARESGEPLCTFGGEWWNLDAVTLAVEGECRDGRARDIVLRFERAPEPGAILGAPTIVSVGGEGGWVHRPWEWRFKLCLKSETSQTCK